MKRMKSWNGFELGRALIIPWYLMAVNSLDVELSCAVFFFLTFVAFPFSFTGLGLWQVLFLCDFIWLLVWWLWSQLLWSTVWSWYGLGCFCCCLPFIGYFKGGFFNNFLWFLLFFCVFAFIFLKFTWCVVRTAEERPATRKIPPNCPSTRPTNVFKSYQHCLKNPGSPNKPLRSPGIASTWTPRPVS